MNAVEFERKRAKLHLGNIQALRAIAALLVLLIHASLDTVGIEAMLPAGQGIWLSLFRHIGLFGVDLFFVISGFIMIVTNWNNFAQPWAGVRFFVRRAIRIYPPYWFALIPAFAVLLLAKDRFMVSHVGVKTGIFESILLLPNPNHFVLTVAWTLVWEMIFYVVFAFLIHFDRRYVARAIAAWFVVQVIFYVLFTGSPNFYLNFIATPLPMEFIFGTIVGLLYVNERIRAPRLTSTIAVVAALGMSVVVVVFQLNFENINDISRILVFGTSAMLLVYAGVALESCGAFTAPAWLQRIGDGSYAIYLWHISILVALRQVIIKLHPHGPVAHAAVIVASLAIIIVFGMAVYRWFERPLTDYLNGMLFTVLPAPPKNAPMARGLTPTAAE